MTLDEEHHQAQIAARQDVLLLASLADVEGYKTRLQKGERLRGRALTQALYGLTFLCHHLPLLLPPQPPSWWMRAHASAVRLGLSRMTRALEKDYAREKGEGFSRRHFTPPLAWPEGGYEKQWEQWIGSVLEISAHDLPHRARYLADMTTTLGLFWPRTVEQVCFLRHADKQVRELQTRLWEHVATQQRQDMIMDAAEKLSHHLPPTPR